MISAGRQPRELVSWVPEPREVRQATNRPSPSHLWEEVRIQFRTEMFNAFNHAQFNTPNGNRGSVNFGRISSARAPRLIQFGLKVICRHSCRSFAAKRRRRAHPAVATSHASKSAPPFYFSCTSKPAAKSVLSR